VLTYQLQSRAFKLEEGTGFAFPGYAEIELKLAPATAFGTDTSPGRTVVRARKASVVINANTGRWQAKSDPSLEPLEALYDMPQSSVSLAGDILRYTFQCNDVAQLESTIAALKWIFPPLLNLMFSDPPIVLYVRGKVGDAKFRWEHRPEEWQIQMRTVTAEQLGKHFLESFENLSLFNGILNRRLAAAISYFHIAVRLNVCGDSPWEFMAETILNYCKCLDILFARTKNTYDDARQELRALGYTDDEVEGDFVPLLILRSWVDIAHPKVAIYKSDDLRVLYKYVSQSEDCIRELLNRIITKSKSGTYSVQQDADLSLDDDEKKDMHRLVLKMKSRLRGPTKGG